LSRWPAIRALLLGAAFVIGLIDGCPVPSERNLQRWPAALVPCGRKLTATRAWLMTPFAWIGDGLGVSQRWSLFSAPDENRFRMWIEARAARGSWQILFRAHDPLHDYQADLIEYRRLRGAWNIYKRGPNAGYPLFVDWISRTIFLDPALKFDEVRVRMEPIDVSPGGRALVATGAFQHEERRSRSALLGGRAK
jgi:hypothetical protein